MAEASGKRSLNRVLGRSVRNLLFGNFFNDKNNSASLIAIILVLILCYAVLFQGKDYINGLLNIVFVVIGYYFGSKPSSKDESKDDE
jgi:hypothetical protein